MRLGLIVDTNDPERVWNAFRLATTALEDGHDVETFLLGDGVEASELDHEKFNPHGIMLKYVQNDSELLACGTCLDSRDLSEGRLRPRATMSDLVSCIDRSDEVVTIG